MTIHAGFVLSGRSAQKGNALDLLSQRVESVEESRATSAKLGLDAISVSAARRWDATKNATIRGGSASPAFPAATASAKVELLVRTVSVVDRHATSAKPVQDDSSASVARKWVVDNLVIILNGFASRVFRARTENVFVA